MLERKKKLKLNNKGSILHIVLILFMIFTSTLLFYSSMSLHVQHSYHDIHTMMKQKNIEIMLIRYYIETIDTDILLSDWYRFDGGEVSYTVDDMGGYYYINTYIYFDNINYRFECDIDCESLEVRNFKYLEG